MRHWLRNFIALLAALLVGGASNARALSVVWRTSGSSPTTLGSFAYTLGPTGNRTALAELVGGTNHVYNWAYDYLYRMTGETFSGTGFTGSPAVTYGFDAVGNRTNRTSSVLGIGSQAPTYTTNDWLASDTYDANGNTIVSGITNYQYDVLGHLTNVNNGQILITYDGDGNRVSKTVNGTTTWYLVDDRNPSGYAQVLEEYQGTNLSRVYNYGLALISQRQVSIGTISYYGTDGHGSTRFLMDVNGNITDTYTFDAYGLLIASSGTTPNNYLYCGQQWDGDLSLYYLRARYYKPDTGRFWTMDTYEGNNEDPLSLHKYLYCQNDPIMGIDPSGHDLGDVMASLYVNASFAAMNMQATVMALGGVATTVAILGQNYHPGDSGTMMAVTAGLDIVSLGGGQILRFPAWAQLSQLKNWTMVLYAEHAADAAASRQAMAAALQFSEQIVQGSLKVGGAGAQGADIVAQATVRRWK